MGKLFSFVGAFTAVASGSLAVAVIAIIRAELWYYSGWWWSGGGYSYASACYMTTGGANLCSYGYVVGGVGIMLSIGLFFLQIAKLRPSWTNHSKWELLMSGFGVIWWLPFCVTATVYGKRADDAGLPMSYDRRNVWILSWTVFALFVVHVVIAILDWDSTPKPVAVGGGGMGGAYTSPGPPAGAGYGGPPPPAAGYGAPPPSGVTYAYGSPVYGQPVGMGTYPPQGYPAQGYGGQPTYPPQQAYQGGYQQFPPPQTT